MKIWNRNRWIAYTIASCFLTAAPSSSAARRSGTVATTGYLSLTPGHVALLTVADIAPNRGKPTSVKLEILDGENQVLERLDAELLPGKPLTLEVRGDRVIGDRLPVRARVVVLDDVGFRGRARRSRAKPILSFELVNDDGDVNYGVICPFVGGRGVEFFGGCGCIFTDFLAPS